MINVGRVLVGGRNNQTIAEQVRSHASQGQTPTLVRAVVLEVISDPDELTEESLSALRDNLTNPEFLDNLPPNSIIGKVVTANQSNLVDLCSVFYPLYQSHIALPLQAGEHVWIMYDDFAREGAALGRWVTRVHENYATEDPNFTHSDRRFDASLNLSLQRTGEQANRNQGQEPPKPSFPNGGGTVDSYTLKPSGSVNPYESIYQNSDSSKLHTYESVPRWIKRPQELVLQGMNNALISLGQDRDFGFKVDPNNEKRNHSGTIDIVCGRGRYPLETTDTTIPVGKETSPYVVENTRNKIETDKSPKVRRKSKNRNEGNPNYKTDAARVFVTANSNVDKKLRIAEGLGTTYPNNTIKPTEAVEPNEKIGVSFVAAKADHVRIVARTEELTGNPKIEGTILLVKEGTEDNGLAYMYFDKNGNVQLDGKRIFLGQALTGDVNGADHAEPYIKWSVYNSHINELKAQIKNLSEHVQNLVKTYQAAFASSIAIPFVPIASLTTAGTSTVTTTEAKISEIKSKLESINPSDAKSQKIFGE